MNKRRIILFGLLLTAAAMGFAAGQTEAPAGPAGELISLEGTLHFEDRFWPELETSSGTYRLMAPRILPAGVEVAEGDRIAVEGYAVPGPAMGRQRGDEKFLAVTKAVIHGEEYVVNRPFGPGPGSPGGSACCAEEQWGPRHHYPGQGRRGMMHPPMGAFGWSRS